MLQYVFGYAVVELGDVAVRLAKQAITKKELAPSGKYPAYNSGREIYGLTDSYNNEGDALVVTSHGEYCGYTHYVKGKFWAGALCFPYTVKKIANIRYVFHYLSCNEESIRERFRKISGVPYISQSELESLRIPLPPLEEQNRIVAILDRFDSLCNDLSQGLPAEIEARRKQYEYYRDRLLEFKVMTDD